MNPITRLTLFGVTGLALAGAPVVHAADHQEAPGTQADLAADLADLYAWHDTAADKLVFVLTYAGLRTPGSSASFDNNVEYGIHIDTDGDAVADRTIRVRYESDNSGADMVLENFPGAPARTSVRVGSAQTVSGGGRAYAGAADDPFFFDLEGFGQTLQTGTLSFDGTRDSFAGLNVTAIVLEMSWAATANGSQTLATWATTARK